MHTHPKYIPLKMYLRAAAILGVVCLLMMIGSCADAPRTDIEPVEFIIVTEENAADTLAEEPSDAKEEPPEPEPPPAPEPVPDTPPPPPPVPDPDPIPEPPKPVTPPEKKKVEKKKPEPKKAEKPAEKKPAEKPKPKRVEIKTGKRTGPITTGKKDVTKAATAAKTLSDDEIKRMLGLGARAGNRNSIPRDEASRCYGVIVRVIQDALAKAGLEEAPTGRAPILKVEFSSGGSIRSIKIETSSGDREYDNQVLMAARTVRRVSGLSAAFLRDYPSVSIRVNVD